MKKNGNQLVVYPPIDDLFIDELSIKISSEDDRIRFLERLERKKYLQQVQDLTKKEIRELSEIKLYEAIEKVSNKVYGD